MNNETTKFKYLLANYYTPFDDLPHISGKIQRAVAFGLGIGDWGLGQGDWGLGIGDWDKGKIPITNYQLPITQNQFF
ncbi:hypothetical protein IQ278_31430 [Tolypothrix sp. LEGE 11397]|uniref:hypothetical protein n=1 Tax=Tolypothrix sp. LEGE 11397 TaxID=2777971 RepID=UPI0005EAB2D3|nr:hypothetical protein [Tolypothrix sp. LEGE 11397]EKF03958.1 hypothetical protein FDUTEX481_02961 [Tolypothrix sp. PCC 7601]MBE9086555.1 hypothetical protein [Tolypothrix sp. LEGE 11397]